MIQKIKNLFATPTIPDYIALAKSQISVKEYPGPGDNPKIVEYHAATKLKSTEDEVAWCSSFINWVFMKTGYERSHSAAARSWLGFGKRLSKFKPYCVVVFKRGTEPWQGHVTFGIQDKGTYILCLGGNQSNSVSYATYSKKDVLGYFEPVKLKGEQK